MAKTIAFRLEINGFQREIQNTKELKAALLDVRKALDLKKFGTPEYERLANTQARLLNVSQRLQAQARNTRNEIKASGRDAQVADGSYEALSAELSVLTYRWKAMGREARESMGKGLLGDINRVTRELKELDRQRGVFGRNVGNYGEAVGQLGARFETFFKGGFILAGADILINRIGQLGQKVFEVNSTISDSLGDVQRIAQLTDAQAQTLLESIKAIDTRTTLDDLLKFAAVGARLGVAAPELSKFSKAIDDINVALGGELGGDVEGIANTLGKLSSIFIGGDITGEKIQNIGNAIISLANAGVASGPFLADLAQRLAGIKGIADQLKLGDALGLGAAFEELGASAEVSGTAVTQILLKMGQDTEKFAKLAGKDVKEFSKTLNADPVEALIQLAEGLQNNKSGLEEVSKAFAEAEVKGVRVAATLGVLGSNTDKFREKIQQGRDALKDTDQILGAVAIKQNTLGASTEKLRNAFDKLIQGEGITKFFKGVVDGVTAMLNLFNRTDPMTKLRGEFDGLSERVRKLDSDLPPLLERYKTLQAITNPTTEEQEELKKVIGEIAVLTPSAVTEIDRYGNALSISAEKSQQLYESEKLRLSFVNRDLIKGITEEIKQADALIRRNQTLIKQGGEIKRIGDAQDKIGGTVLVSFTDAQLEEIKQRTREANEFVTGAAIELASRSGKGVQDIFAELGIAIPKELKAALGPEGPIVPEFARSFDKTGQEMSAIAKRTVAEIKAEIESLESALSGTSNRGEASAIQGRIKELEKELEAILGASKKSQEAAKFAIGSIGALREEISKLEKDLDGVVSEEQYVKVFRRIDELTQELNRKQRELDNSIIASLSPSGGEPEQLEQLGKNLDNWVDYAVELKTILLKLGEDRVEIEKSTWERVNEISAQNAAKASDQLKKIKREELDEKEKTEEESLKRTEKLYLETAHAIGEVTGKFLAGEIETTKDFFKELLLIVLQALEGQIAASIAAAVGTEAGSKPYPANIATAALKVAAITAAFTTAKLAISSGFEQGKESPIVGYTGHGSTKQVAGVVHKDEEVIPSRTLHHPKAGRHIMELRKISQQLGYKSGKPGFETGRFAPIIPPSPTTGTINFKATVDISPESIKEIQYSVMEGSKAGSKTGIKEANTDTKRREKLTQKTGF